MSTNPGKKKKSTVAVVVMIAAIVLSIPLGVNRSFARLRNDVENEYYYDDTGYSIWQGVDNRVATAKSLLTLAERYVDRNPELDVYMDDLEYRIQLCDGHNYFDELDMEIQENSVMSASAQALADELNKMELDEKDKKYPDQLMADLNAEQDKLERSSYNDAAMEYNEKLTRFPVNLLRHISGVDEMGVFYGD